VSVYQSKLKIIARLIGVTREGVFQYYLLLLDKRGSGGAKELEHC
jgi:hypothetical protein